jgi:hypothetical protein
MRFFGLAVVAFVLSAPSSGAAPVCWFGSAPCFFACGDPPRLTDGDHAALQLRASEYGKISWLDQSSAIITTQFFKCIGINGWKRYRFKVYAVGRVDQAATSWDGLRTVDIVLENFDDSALYRQLPATHYIRAEIVRRVWKCLDHPPSPGDHIRVEGELHWDGHGFLEIHPSQNGDVQYLLGTTTINDPPALNPAGV